MITHKIPGLILTEHDFTVPLDYTDIDKGKITVFAREVVAAGKEDKDLPWLLFLQGGPGFGAPRPEFSSGWLKRALREYRVLLLDQRGTGRSTPVLTQTLTPLSSPQAQADYLKHFRQDSIVKDAEFIRRNLIGAEHRWSVLGQSYGGFCAVHYLSAAPEGLREVIITGGLPPLQGHIDRVYRATYRTLIEKNKLYYTRYPEDIRKVREIVEFLNEHNVHLPNGDILSPRRFRQLGIAFGASNGFEQMHYLLELAFVNGSQGKTLSYPFLVRLQNALAYDTHPIYAILHEPIYCQGFSPDWSAERIMSEFPEFTITPDHPIFFTGEMIYPWMFEEYNQLRPLRDAAEILAHDKNWPELYDLSILNHNQVPCVAAIYYNDMYVDRNLSEETAQEINELRLWITNEYEHSALRLHGERLLDKLLKMLHGG